MLTSAVGRTLQSPDLLRGLAYRISALLLDDARYARHSFYVGRYRKEFDMIARALRMWTRLNEQNKCVEFWTYWGRIATVSMSGSECGVYRTTVVGDVNDTAHTLFKALLPKVQFISEYEYE